jgi:hypothetical protein
LTSMDFFFRKTTMNNSYRIVRYQYILIILLILCTSNTQSQNWSSLYNYLDNKDKDLIDEAIKSINDAGDYTKQANIYYNDALKEQSANEASQSPNEKKIAKLESKALDQQMKADKLYSGACKKIYEVCDNHLKNLGSVSTGTNEYKDKAAEMMNEASGKRKEADENKKPYEKGAILNEAAGLENAAIENLIIAICVAHGDNSSIALSAGGQNEDADVQNKILLSIEKTLSAEDTSSIRNTITVDADLILKYEKYIADSSIPEPIAVTRSGILAMDGFDRDKLMQEYGNYNNPNYQAEEAAKINNTTTDSTLSNMAANSLLNADKQKSNPFGSGKSNSLFKSKNGENRDSTYMNSIPAASDVRFMIQIAASRIQLTRAQLWAIYPGNLSVEVVHEDNWYKYRITGFRYFSEASDVATESGAKNAIVIASYNGRKINLEKAKEMTHMMEVDSKQNEKNSASGLIDFYVQFAASKVLLSDKTISELTADKSACREVIEEGWFKYQIFTGTDYKDALRLRKSMSVKAFVVAYKGGTKINLYQAIHNRK